MRMLNNMHNNDENGGEEEEEKVPFLGLPPPFRVTSTF